MHWFMPLLWNPSQLLSLQDCGLRQVPRELAGLTPLRKLLLCHNAIEGGWQHVPRQLLSLDLRDCSLQQVPAQLAGMTQLTELTLCQNNIVGGWQHVPQQLLLLDLARCNLRQVPAELAGRNLQISGIRPL